MNTYAVKSSIDRRLVLGMFQYQDLNEETPKRIDPVEPPDDADRKNTSKSFLQRTYDSFEVTNEMKSIQGPQATSIEAKTKKV